MTVLPDLPDDATKAEHKDVTAALVAAVRELQEAAYGHRPAPARPPLPSPYSPQRSLPYALHNPAKQTYHYVDEQERSFFFTETSVPDFVRDLALGRQEEEDKAA